MKSMMAEATNPNKEIIGRFNLVIRQMLTVQIAKQIIPPMNME